MYSPHFESSLVPSEATKSSFHHSIQVSYRKIITCLPRASLHPCRNWFATDFLMITWFLLRNRLYENRLCDHPKGVQAFSPTLFLAHHGKKMFWSHGKDMIQPFRNPEYVISNLEKDIRGEDNIGVPGKEKNIPRKTLWPLFLPV